MKSRSVIPEANMKSDQERLLNLKRLPVYLNTEQMADYLNLLVSDVHILSSEKFLPLAGNSGPGEKKLFVTAKIEKLLEDNPDWPDKMRHCLVAYHRRRNASRKWSPVNGEAEGLADSRNGKNHK